MKRYTVTLDVTGSTRNITSVTSNCGTKNVNIIVDTGVAGWEQDIADAMNDVWFQDPQTQDMQLFEVTSSGGTATISTKCSICAIISIVYGGKPFLFTESGDCDEAYLKVDIELDCDNPQCIQFTDVTKLYNNPANTGGYGYPPNYPSISNIDHVEFSLFDINDSNQEYRYTNSGYVPNALGNNQVCLEATNFLKVGDNTPLPEYVPGTLFNLQYRVYTDNGGQFNLTVPIVISCCGSATASSLTTNYSILQKAGCGSFDFSDNTGVYNAETNPGGYGAPNPAYNDIYATLIKFMLGDGREVSISSFIPTEDDFTINITAADLGYADGNIPDQIIEVEYSIYATGMCRIGYKSEKILFHCNTGACIRNKSFALTKANCAPCLKTDEQKTVDNILSLIFRYEAMLTASVGSIGCMSGDIEKLYKDCSKDCADCK